MSERERTSSPRREGAGAGTGPRRPSLERGEVAGAGLVRLAWIGVVITCASSVGNALTGDRDAYVLSAAPNLVLFALGCGAFLWAFALAVERSRAELIGIGGLFFLSGCAPAGVQRSMLAALAVQTTVPVAVAVVRPFTAFAVLAPMWALGLAGLWGARHGVFLARGDGPDGVGSEPGPRGRPDAPD